MDGPWAGVPALALYGSIALAAIVEGELTYIGAAALVADGRLHPVAVLVAGALGAAIGDQAYFYAFRGRLPRWLARYPSLARKTAPLVGRVRRHASLMVLLIRFAPGLRVALAAACAAADVPPRTVSTLNLLSSFVWAAALLVLVAWLGPAFLARFGLAGWQAALLAGLTILVLFRILASYERRAIERSE
jgi:membrane protein DedA with SNARE-associated domain